VRSLKAGGGLALATRSIDQIAVSATASKRVFLEAVQRGGVEVSRLISFQYKAYQSVSGRRGANRPLRRQSEEVLPGCCSFRSNRHCHRPYLSAANMIGAITIANFNTSRDVIDISHSLGLTVGQLMALTSDNAQGNAQIHLDANDSITLIGVHSAMLHPSDFQIV